MAYSQLPTRSTANTNASADINQLQDNIDAILGSEATSGPSRTIPNLAGAAGTLTSGKVLKGGGSKAVEAGTNDEANLVTMASAATAADYFLLSQGANRVAKEGWPIGTYVQGIGSNNVARSGSVGSALSFQVPAGAPTVAIGVGKWILYGSSGLTTIDVPDWMYLQFWNDTDGLLFGIGGAGISTVNQFAHFTCVAFLNITSGTKNIYLGANRAGGSTLAIGSTSPDAPSGIILAHRIG